MKELEGEEGEWAALLPLDHPSTAAAASHSLHLRPSNKSLSLTLFHTLPKDSAISAASPPPAHLSS